MSCAETDLDTALRHVRRGKEIVFRQRELVDELEARGQNAAVARKLLAEFEATQQMNEEHLARLRAEPS